MTKTIRTILLLLLLATKGYAQPSRNDFNSLLWKISGNGLKNPSYLYGTMHLTDKRIFNFSDSLYYFLEKSDGFANEVDMGSLMPEIMSSVNDESKKELIKDLVSAGMLKPYQKALEKALKKKLELITVRDLSEIKSKNSSRALQHGEMSAIVDVYLYDIARRQGKWVGGIEDMEDQFRKGSREDEIMELVENAVADQSEYDHQIEWMIKTYLDQRLDNIDLTNQLWRGAEKRILIRRNLKMARRIDSVMQFRTCLFAIGAAHIPGDSGVITLLRQRGFTVQAVHSQKNIEPGQYRYISREIPWVDAEIRDNWYNLQMPGKAEPIKLDGEAEAMSSMMYYDLTRMIGYFTFGLSLDTGRRINTDSLYGALAKNYSRKGKITSSKNITVNKISGKEYIMVSDGNDLRLQVFIPGPSVVLNMVVAVKRDSIYGRDANRFFESFHFLKAPPAPAAVNWQKYFFPKQGFAIQSPLPLKKVAKKTDADSIWKSTYYTATSADSKVSCWMVVMDAKPGYFSDADSGYFERTKNAIAANFKGARIISSTLVNYAGFPDYHFSLKMKYNDENLEMKSRLINRGNRRYYFYVVNAEDPVNSQQAMQFVNSFEFLPRESSEWSYHFSPKHDISVWSPATINFNRRQDTSISSVDYSLYDSLSPATVLITKQYLSPYSWWKTDSAFFRQQADLWSSESGDSLINFRMISGSSPLQADYSVISPDNHNRKRVHLLLNGDTLYSVFAFLPPDLIYSPDYNKLFEEIKVSKVKPAGYHLVPKTDQILAALAKGDSAEFTKANEALTRANFTKEDLAKLQQALLLTYREFEETETYTHVRLIKKILELEDGSTLGFIRDHYSELRDDKKWVRGFLLYTLLRLKTRASFDLFLELASKNLAFPGHYQLLESGLTDSLQLTSSIFPGLLKLSQDTGFIQVLPAVATSLLDSNLVEIASIEPFRKQFYEYAGRVINRMNSDIHYYTRARSIIDLMRWFKDPAADDILRRMLNVPDLAINCRAAIGLVKKGQVVDPLQLEKIAKDNFYRLLLFENLQTLGKESLFPARFNTQRLMALSDLTQSTDDLDDLQVDSISFVAEKTQLFKGKTQNFLLFKVLTISADDEKGTHLGITGPYPKVKGKTIPRSQLAGVYWDEDYDPKKTDSQLKEYLQQMADIDKEAEPAGNP